MRVRLVTLSISHVVMITVMRTILAMYKPDPSGFRLDDVGEVLLFALSTSPPLIVGLASRSVVALGIVAFVHALSPTALIPAARHDDLNFAALLWWSYIPALAAVVVVADRVLAHRRAQRSADHRPAPGS